MSLKTSRTDPIQVVEISYELGVKSPYSGSRRGVIGISMCPGKKGPSHLEVNGTEILILIFQL